MTVTNGALTRGWRGAPGRRTRRSGASGLGTFRSAFPFLVVGLALYGIFVIYPMIQAVVLSFYNWNGTGSKDFAGWSNYAQLFKRDAVFTTALRNTFIWTGLALVVPNSLALFLAVVLNGKVRGRIALRTAFYLPSVLATIVVAMTWNLVYDPTAGLFNNALQRVGLGHLTHAWLGEPNFAIFAVFIASAWQTTGISMVLFLAGLQSVNPDLVDAAAVDGASRLQVFRRVELPALRPMTAVVLVLSVINALKAFDLIYAMTRGGPGDSSQVLASYAWTTGLVNRDIGLGSAIATVLLVFALAAMLPYLRWAFREFGAAR